MNDSLDFPVRPFIGPGRTLVGKGAIAMVDQELKVLGAAPSAGPVLVVADRFLTEEGIADHLNPLHEAGFEPVVAPGVAGEPSPETIEGLIAATGGRRAAAVVAIGGGSTLDAAKLAAAAQTNEIDFTAGLTGAADIAPPPPLVAVPTTAGTGSEATAVAMLWHEGRKVIFVHPRLLPDQAILDPDFLANLPRDVLAATGLDAISHAVESMLSTFRTPLTVGAAESALARLGGAIRAEHAESSEATRLALMLGAYEAGLALNASVVIGHSLAYTIAARTGLSHGVTCAMALPYCLAYNRAVSAPQLERMARVVGAEGGGSGFVDWLRELNSALGMPASLEEVGVARSDLAGMVTECCEVYPRPNNPRPMDPGSIRDLLERFHSGDFPGAWDPEGGTTA